MKQIKCSEMMSQGGCDFVITGGTATEMIDNGWKHLQEVHPEMAENIMKNPKEENDKWMAEFSAKFDTLPEMESSPEEAA